LNQIKDFINLHLSNENLSLEDFGKEFPMSISSIQKNIKRICGKSLFQLILETRLIKAKTMIEADTAPISEVLYQCGFNNHNHFTKKFKEHFGILPSKMKKNEKSSIS
jgi:AraC-like DNA-binding protein